MTPVVGLLRDDPPYSTPRVLEVAGEAWDEMDMEVRHGLPCSRAIVDADIEAIWTELQLRGDLGLVEQGEHGCALFGRDLKEGGDVSLGDDEAMARRHGIAVPNPDSVVVAANDALRGQRAEGARLDGHS